MGYKQASENIEIFKVKLRWGKSSRFLQSIAFLDLIFFIIRGKTHKLSYVVLLWKRKCQKSKRVLNKSLLAESKKAKWLPKYQEYEDKNTGTVK